MLRNLFAGVYVECEIAQMCAWISEKWLNKEGIYEQDVDGLSFADPTCSATDVGSLEGLPEDLHFWLWCSTEIPEEPDAEHQLIDGLKHYDCGTDTEIHQGENYPGMETWKTEPHIRHNNTISTKGKYILKQISLPVQCEWPTSLPDQKPVAILVDSESFNPSYFKSEKDISLEVNIKIFTDESFSQAYEDTPNYLLGQRVFVQISLKEDLMDSTFGIEIKHFWGSPDKSVTNNIYFAWINEFCATEEEIRPVESSSPSQLRFSLPSFRFHQRDPKIYLHAFVKACKKEECKAFNLCGSRSKSFASFESDRRKRRSIGDSSHSTVISIPVSIPEKEQEETADEVILNCYGFAIGFGVLLLGANVKLLL
ncbi:Oidioi.mRNA.OKI2018_I69.chr2.g5198.t1.cds [Oikopleura dioica]|uniref:Oidioi.mRNA.OKI2018_I69.chr2.g5198.t1.cds n=1 Tax=Oikopleura dioica TaxID=34765 RepID=A0ABN7T8T7_OIKDI|nr:Oidioi.mRNA.OKI2018_I69.chr2.g5198.t1.cds [Oikopleura dioica]